MRYLLCSLFLSISLWSSAQFWTQNASNFITPSTGVSKFHIVDANVVWALGFNGINPATNLQEFTRTIDSGANWIAGNVTVGDAALGIADIAGINDSTAVVATYPRIAGQSSSVFRTNDRGLTWSQITSASFNGATSFANSIHFFNATDGVVMGDAENGFWEIYTTLDAGLTYSRVSAANLPAPLAGETGYLALHTAVGNSIWFMTSAGRIVHSSDKGLTWSVYQSPISDFGSAAVNGDIAFSDNNKGILQNQDGDLWTTMDSGATWTVRTITGTGSPYGDSIAYVPFSTRVISTGADASFSGTAYSLDDGRTWINVTTAQHIDVEFLTEDIGYSGGFTSNSNVNGVYVYSDTVLSSEDLTQTALIKVYPVPARENITIETRDQLKNAAIYDLSGRLILNDNQSAINTSSLTTGTYLLKVTTTSGSYTQSIIKQ